MICAIDRSEAQELADGYCLELDLKGKFELGDVMRPIMIVIMSYFFTRNKNIIFRENRKGKYNENSNNTK